MEFPRRRVSAGALRRGVAAPVDRPGLFHRFGIMTDDYTPKPAFDVFRDLLAGAAGFSPRRDESPRIDLSGSRPDRSPPPTRRRDVRASR
jgi:hypothetical protein